MLNIPISVTEKLKNCTNILIAGAGGGSDILCGLPLYYTLLKQGKKVHLANLTHTDLKTLGNHTEPIKLDSSVFGANSIIKIPSQNYVEGYLSQFFKAALNEEKVVWMIERTAVPQLKKSYERLIDHLKIDGLILIDGGVDSIMMGDEGNEMLTSKFLDTTVTLAAIQNIEEIQDKIVVVSCNDNSKNQRIINSNLSTLSLQGGVYGGCYILNYMNSFKFLKTIYNYIKDNNTLPNIKNFIKLTDSDFSEDEEKLGLIQYLFFNPQALVYNNVAIHKIIELETFYDIIQNIAPMINKIV